MTKFRLGIISTHPIQYQVPLFRYLADRSPIEPVVFFLTRHGMTESFDSGFGQAVKFDVPLLDGYCFHTVANRSPRPDLGTPWGVFNPSLPKLIRNSGIDALLVHGYNLASHWLAYGTALATRIPYLLRGDSRTERRPTSPAKSLAKRAILQPLVRNASACLAIGSENRKFYTDYGAAPEKIFFAPYSVDTDRFAIVGASGRSRRRSMVASLGLDPEIPLVLFAAKLQSWKRPADLVRAMDQLEIPANLVVIGDGPLRPTIEALTAARPWMRVLGFVNQTEIAAWYGAADLFVLPSSREQWGLAVNEAMAAGAVPIVSDSVGCAPDLVTPDVGWVYPTGDVGALASVLAQGCQPGALPDRRTAARQRSEQYGLAATAHGIEMAVAAARTGGGGRRPYPRRGSTHSPA